jgi:hypothetical protein
MSIEAMKLALEALEYAEENHGGDDCYADSITALRAAIEQAEKQEPVAWWHDMGDVVDLNVSGRGTPLYTAPPQRSWQGLTPEEVKEISLANRPYVVDMVVALEARLKEKNGY